MFKFLICFLLVTSFAFSKEYFVYNNKLDTAKYTNAFKVESLFLIKLNEKQNAQIILSMKSYIDYQLQRLFKAKILPTKIDKFNLASSVIKIYSLMLTSIQNKNLAKEFIKQRHFAILYINQKITFETFTSAMFYSDNNIKKRFVSPDKDLVYKYQEIYTKLLLIIIDINNHTSINPNTILINKRD